MLSVDSKGPQLGVVISASERDVTVRHRSGKETSLPMGQCVPVTHGDNTMNNRVSEPMSHFISLEIRRDKLMEAFVERLQELQQDLSLVPNIGKPVKTASLHITMATLNIHDEEMSMVTGMLDTAIKRYIDLTNPTTGLVVGFQGVGFGDEACWASMTLGSASLMIMRELIEDEAGRYLNDKRFTPHLSVFKKCNMEEETKEGVKSSVRGTKLGCLTIQGISLRKRKTTTEVPEPLHSWTLMNL